MRTSCNGCRVLRKGCSEFCVLRTCLHWINTAESQENATIFLAKFYGRAGLINLISTAPEELRPDIFRSLLYDACGRIVNPIYGSLGLLLSGNWQECQAGVDSVLHGSFPAIKRDNFMSPARKIMVPVGGTVRRELHRSMKGRGRGRMKGPSVAQPTVQKLEKGKFNGEYVETYSTFLSGQERDEFLAAKPQMGSCSDLICSVKSVRDESPACNSLELDLTLRSHSSISLPTSREVSAVDIRRSDAHWDHCMLETYLP